MEKKDLITILLYGGIIWILSNIIIPLIVNSIDRHYHKQVDFIIGKLILFLRFLTRRTAQIFLIILFLPNILLCKVLDRLYPKAFRNKELEEVRWAMYMILDTDFPSELIKEMKKNIQRHRATRANKPS